jgi:hypothetical protein
MTQEDAEAVARWHYPSPFSFYERVGFVRRRTYTHWTLGRDWEFIEMRRPAQDLTPAR